MKKILFVSHASGLDGAERFLIDLVSRMHGSRFIPSVVCPFVGPMVDELRSISVPVDVVRQPFMGQRAQEILLFAVGVTPATLRLARYVRESHCHVVYSNSLQNPYGVLAARLAGVPCIWHVHELVANPVVRVALTQSATLLADRLIVVSRAVGAMFSERARQTKVRMVYNGVNTSYFSPESVPRALARAAFALDDSQPTVAVIARFCHRKGHYDLLCAMPELLRRWPDCLLLAPGHGPLQSELISTTRRLGIENNVRFLGFVPDIRQVMAAADVLVLPSYKEAFGRVLIEAMSMGIPVVATDEAGPQEVVSPDVGLRVPFGNPRALASAIAILLEDRELAKQMGRCGRQKVLDLFSLDRAVEAVERILAELVDERARSCYESR